jgi:O-glycosyl hydrolase
VGHRFKTRIIVIVCGLGIANALQSFLHIGYSSAQTSNVMITVNNAIQYQMMEGFGATNIALWYDGGTGDTLGPTLRAKAIDAVYNQVKLNTGQIDAALLESPGSYEQRANDNSDPNVINWNGFQKKTADNAKTLLIDPAKQYGFTDYYIDQKINVRWASPWLASLRSSDYNRYLDEAAEQVAAGALYWKNTYGITTKFIMLFNEPIMGNGELNSGSWQEMGDLIKRAGERLKREGFSNPKFVVPNEERVGASFEEARALLSDPEVRQYIGAIGYHPYPYESIYANIPNILRTSGSGSPDANEISTRQQLRDLAAQHGIPLYMTEVSTGGVDPRSFDDLRGRAIHIHDEFVYANASAYFGMQNMWDTRSQQLHFNGDSNVYNNEGQAVLIDNPSGTVTITGMGYAIGHYSRWFKKGARRIEAASTDPLVLVSAFRDDSQKRLVLVAINNATSPKAITVSLTGISIQGQVVGEQSTATAAWKPLSPVNTSSSTTYTLTLPARSITSLVAATGTGPLPSVMPTPRPTVSQVPTNTQTTKLQLIVFLHGIGKGGDNVNPSGLGTTNPLHQNRSVIVEVSNTANQVVASKQGLLHYSLTAGNFQGTIDLGNLPTGSYTGKIKVSQYLQRILPGILTFTTGQTTSASPVFLIAGDSNDDNVLSILDYNLLIDCFSELTPARNCSDSNKKQMTDLTDDGNVNQFDYNLLLRELSVQSGH